MLLVIKLNFDDFQAYRQEFNKCLKYNCENTHIQEIILLTDLNINDIPKHTKLKHIVKRGISSTEAIDYAKRISKQDKIIFSNSFFIFTHELNRIDWNTIPIQTNNYTIFNRQTNYKMVNMSPQPSRDILKESVDIHQLKEDTIVTEVIRKKGELVKVEPKLNQQQLEKIDVVIVSVNYNDYLLLSLTNNTKLFSNITVVTSSDDLMCQRICEKFGVKCVITDRMYENGATFNKGKAINEGINSIENPGWILLLDADIVVEDKIDLKSLSWDHLYISDRWICTDYQRYKNYKSGEIPLESIGEYEVNKGLGFFQLFNASKERFFPETSEDAAWSDLMFRDKFSKRKDIENKIIHLGHAYKNWDGRVTSRFISDEEFHSLIPKDFDINEYFDKIYCINLDRRLDRWIKTVEQFKYFNIRVERFSAIDGDVLNFEQEGLISDLSDLGLIENKNALGCLLSHLKVIEDAKKKNYKKILIFEDDILISKEFKDRIKECKNINWSILYLGASQFNWDNIDLSSKFYECENTLGTFAYAIDHELFDEVIETLKNSKKSVDNSMAEIQSRHKKKCLTYFPNIVISDVNDSDIRESKNMSSYCESMKWNPIDFIRLNKEYSLINKEKALLNLIELDQLFRKIKVEYWLTCGTLLGFYRENDFIGHDKDTDICIDSKDFNGYVLKRIKSKGFEVINFFGTIEDGFEISFRKNGVKLDIFLFYKREKWYNSVYSDFKDNDYLKHNYIYDPFEISEKVFLGYSFKVPKDTEKWIISHYGTNYKNPDKDWLWWSSPYNLEETNIRIKKDESTKSLEEIVNFDKKIYLENLTILVKSFMRYDCLLNLIKSIRQFYPEIKIIIVDDSGEDKKFDIDDNIKTYNIEFDSGLSKGRNFGVSKIETEFFLLLDDDFEFTENTDLVEWMDIMIESDLDILGADVIMDGKKMEYFADLELINGVLHYRPEKNIIKNNCKLCDMVLNFFIAKTDMIRKHKWDDDLKLAEHTAYFFEHRGKIKVGHTDKISILHQKINEGDYSQYRNRGRFFFNEWMKKKGIEESINLQGISTKTKY